MSEQSSRARRSTRVTRRQLLGGVGGAAVGGAVLGGAGGYLAASSDPSSAEGSAAAGAPLTIGALVPVTGPGAADGEEMLRGMRLAAAELNASGGVGGRPIRFSVLDAKDQAPNVMTTAVRKFVSDRVALILSPNLTSTSVELPIAGRAGVPLIHMNTLQASVDFAVEHGYRNIFEACPPETWYGPGFVATMDELTKSGAFEPRTRTAAIVSATDGYSISIAQGFKAEVEKLGWRVVQFDKYVSPQAEWGGVLGRVRHNDPDVLFQSDFYAGNEASLIKQFVAAPTRTLVYQQYAPSVPQYRELSGSASDGVLWATVTGSILDDEPGRRFAARYREKYDREPGRSNAGSQYDVVRLWAYAAGLAGDPYDFDAVGDNIRNLVFRGINGTYHMVDQTCVPYPGKYRDPSLGMPLQTYQIQDGEQVLISPSPYSTGRFKTPPWLA